MSRPAKITAPPYHVQSTAATLHNNFPYFPHHDSVSALWSHKWRVVCASGIYPFTEAKVEDFDPIFTDLAKISDDDPGILYRPDDYAQPFLPVADQLISQAEDASSDGNSDQAKELFLRAAAVYRIARLPINRSALTQHAWEKGKAAYEKGGQLLDPPSVPVQIPFTRSDPSAGDRNVAIEAYLRLPKSAKPAAGWPVLLFICGLDAYRTDHTARTQAHVDHGFATLSFEIPGTGDCRAAPNDPASPDRLMSSIIDWVVANARTYGLNAKALVARGVSTGGYYAFRIAHTHSDRLLAVVAQGGGCHHMFDAQWIRAQNQMEYPFALADALAYKFGYRDADSATAIARYAADAGKFSLVETGTAELPTCRMFIVNGMEDSIFPIEDSLIIASQGAKKDLLARGDRGHMGNPGAEDILYHWIDNTVGGGLKRSLESEVVSPGT